MSTTTKKTSEKQAPESMPYWEALGKATAARKPEAARAEPAAPAKAPTVDPPAAPPAETPAPGSAADVLGDMERQAELAAERLTRQRRGAYEAGLLSLARGRKMTDAELSAFYDAALGLKLGRQVMETDANKMRCWLGCIRKVETPERETELQAAVDALDAEQKRLEERLPKIREERAEAYKRVRRAESSRHEATGVFLRNSFPTIAVEPVLVEIRDELLAAGKPVSGLDRVLSDVRANRAAAN